MIEGTEPMKKMHEGAMKKMHASPTKAMSPMKDDKPDYLEKRELNYIPQSQQGKNNLPRLGGKLTKIEKKIKTGTDPKKKMHDGAMKKMHDSAMKAMKAPMKKMESAMKAMDGAMKAMSPKKMAHSPKNMGHSPTKAMSPKKKNELSEADKKRKKALLARLDKMSDPIDSNQGKSILKEIKKIDPNFNPDNITLS
mgnify:CR=1 FL=1